MSVWSDGSLPSNLLSIKKTLKIPAKKTRQKMNNPDPHLRIFVLK